MKYYEKISDKIEKTLMILFPIALFPSEFFELVLYYVGVHNNTPLLKIIKIMLLILFFLVAISRLFFIIKDKNISNKKKYIIPIISIGMITIFFSAIFKFGFGVHIESYLLLFGVTCIPSMIIAMDIGIYNKEKNLMKGLYYYSLLLLPLALIYIAQIVFGINTTRYIGASTYMTIGKVYSVLLFSLSLELIFDNKFVDESKKLHIFLIIIFWLVIILSGLRGSILTVLSVFPVIGIYTFFEKKYSNNFTILYTILLAIWITLTFIWTPASISSSINRFKDTVNFNDIKKIDANVLQGIFDEKIVLEFMYLDNRKAIDEAWLYLVEENQKLRPLILGQGTITPLYNRSILFRFAGYEFSKNIFTGNGVFYFFEKYRMSTHSSLLDLICDVGLIAFSIYFFICLKLLRKLYYMSKNCKYIAMIFMLFISFIPDRLISSFFYVDFLSFFFLVYSLSLGKDFFCIDISYADKSE